MLSSQLSPNWLALAAFVITVVTLVVKRTRSRTTKLRGPPRYLLIYELIFGLLSLIGLQRRLFLWSSK